MISMSKIILIVGLVFGLVSCVTQPSHYEVNTAPYVEKIKVDPVVLVRPEDVQEIGGAPQFQFNLAGKVRTDSGEYTISPDGIEGEVVVDLTRGGLK